MLFSGNTHDAEIPKITENLSVTKRPDFRTQEIKARKETIPERAKSFYQKLHDVLLPESVRKRNNKKESTTTYKKLHDTNSRASRVIMMD